MRLTSPKWTEHYRRAHHAGKRHVKKRPYVLPLLGLAFGLLIVAGTVLAKGDDPALRPSDSHVVFLYDGKLRQTHNTKAKTVGDLVKELPLNLISEDVVEPSLDTPIVEDNFRVNVYRARPVTVVDSNQVKTVALTAQKSPRVVAAAAGVEVYPEDGVKFEPGDIKHNVLGEKVIIDRATPVALNLYGTPVTIRSHAKTVGELLKERNIVPAKDDTVQPGPNTPVTPNVQVFITRFGTKIATVEEAIPSPTEIVSDSTLSFGTNVVRQPGSPGRKSVTYQITTENGRETGRTVIQEVVIQQPVARVVARGTVVAVVGNKAALMSAAGIRVSDHGYVNFIVSRESRWNPTARNPSGAYGLCQALPGSKMASAGSDWATNPVTQLRWCDGYAVGRYGSWAAAYSYWQSHHYW